MQDTVPVTPASNGIKLRFVELSLFRRLGNIQLDIDKKATILVGANNSGKTSILAAFGTFLQMELLLAHSISVYLNGQNCEPSEKNGKT